MGKVSKALNKAETNRETAETGEPPSLEGQQLHHSSADEELNIPPNLETKVDNEVVKLRRPQPQSRDIRHHSLNEEAKEGWNERLKIANEKFSGVAESFRKLRTTILYPEDNKPPRTLLVLSADPHEGKSFVCANLGISLAHGVAKEALLIDCDLRRPSLHTLFGLNISKGLVDYLSGAEDLSSLLLPTGLANLALIPAGRPPDNPAELVASGKMAAMMHNFSHSDTDRLVVLDSPPFLAASETIILAQLVDKVVLVVRWKKSGRDNVKKLIEQIGREKIIGIVFNAFEMNVLDKKIQGVGYHNYYSEAYY